MIEESEDERALFQQLAEAARVIVDAPDDPDELAMACMQALQVLGPVVCTVGLGGWYKAVRDSKRPNVTGIYLYTLVEVLTDQMWNDARRMAVAIVQIAKHREAGARPALRTEQP